MFWQSTLELFKGKKVNNLTLAALYTLGLIFLNTKTSLSQTDTPKVAPEPNKIYFVCATQVEPPTTFIYIPGQVTLSPVMSWYSEYLLPGESAEALCQKTAQVLQTKYDRQEKYFVAAELDLNNEMWKVCLVNEKGEKCTAKNSELLFSLNPNYQSPKCLMESIKPAQCLWSRGGLLSLPGGRYLPTWWPF
jgi:hypothetical protein